MGDEKSKKSGSKPESERKDRLIEKWERVVVDEVFGNGTTRLLRAPRIAGNDLDDFSIATWDEEREDFIKTWKVEAFVGYPSHKHLREGDIFFIRDGSKLTNDYKPIARERAKEKHLLKSWDYSRKLARQEIKEEFGKLSAVNISTGKKRDIRKLNKMVDEKYKSIEEMETKERGKSS